MKKRTCGGCHREFWPRDTEQVAHVGCGGGSGITIVVIPDTQVKPGSDTDHLERIGLYIAEHRPEAIVHLADHYDLPSLSSYDVGKRQFEGRRLKADIEAGKEGLERISKPFAKLAGYKPRMEFMTGNHEYRLQRAIDWDAKLEGMFSMDDLRIEDYGWTVNPFLEVTEIAGVEFAHYFTSGTMGRPVSSAQALLTARSQSAVMGHVQKVDVKVHDKTGQTAIMAGTCYTHDEDYLGPQGNNCRRQIVVLRNVKQGIFDLEFISLDALAQRYPLGNKRKGK